MLNQGKNDSVEISPKSERYEKTEIKQYLRLMRLGNYDLLKNIAKNMHALILASTPEFGTDHNIMYKNLIVTCMLTHMNSSRLESDFSSYPYVMHARSTNSDKTSVPSLLSNAIRIKISLLARLYIVY